MDFDNDEEAKTSLSPKCILEIIGVSKWDGHGRAGHHPNGFLGNASDIKILQRTPSIF